MDTLLIAVWGVVGVLVIGLAWSFFADRPRGRLRCPACWYTIDEPSRKTCPECGRTIANERQLKRTCRHPWRSGAITLGVLLAFYVATCVESIRRDGLLGVVPTIALVWTTDGEHAWNRQQGTTAGRSTEVLLDRMKEHRSSLLSRRAWAAKAADAMPTIPPPRMPIEIEPTVVRVYDLSRFAPLLDPRPVDAGPRRAMPALQPVRDDFHPRSAWSVVISTCRFGVWASSGGVEARGELIGDQLVIRASEGHHEEIARAIGILANPPRRIGEAIPGSTDDLVLVRYELPPLLFEVDDQKIVPREMLGFLRELQEQNRKDMWQSWGGMEAQLHIFRRSFVIETSPDHHKEIAAYIDAQAANTQATD